MTPILTWKTHKGGKNHGSPQTAKCTIMRRLQTMGAQGQRPLVSPLPSSHAVTTRRKLPLSLSLSLSLFDMCKTINFGMKLKLVLVLNIYNQWYYVSESYKDQKHKMLWRRETRTGTGDMSSQMDAKVKYLKIGKPTWIVHLMNE